MASDGSSTGSDGALRRPRRVQRRNVGAIRRSRVVRSVRFTGGDIAARCPYLFRRAAFTPLQRPHENRRLKFPTPHTIAR